jgi:hypothetical protein
MFGYANFRSNTSASMLTGRGKREHLSVRRIRAKTFAFFLVLLHFDAALGLAATGVPTATSARDAADATVNAPRPQKPILEVTRISQRPLLEHFVAAMREGSEPATDLARVEGLRTRVPHDGKLISQKTVVFVGRDESSMYFAFMCFDNSPEKIRSRFSARDRLAEDDDSVAVHLDTFGDQRRAFAFQTNVRGAQLDATWVEGEGWIFDPDWEWYSTGAITNRGYVVLVEIPFRALTFAADGRPWGVVVFRGIPRTGELAYWPAYSLAVQGRMTQAAELRGLEEVRSDTAWRVTPYLAAARHWTPVDGTTSESDAGVDVDWSWRNALQFSATFNPDFGNLESDQPQIGVNQRFELFFPEKRPFFSDGARYYRTPIDLFFSRRIVDPAVGFKMNGQLGSFGVATLYAQDIVQGPIVDESRDILVMRATHEGADRYALGVLGTFLDMPAGRELALSIDGSWRFASQWLAEFQAARLSRDAPPDGHGNSDDAGSLRVVGTGANWSFDLSHEILGRNFRPALGFIPRTGIRQTEQLASYRFRPHDSRLLAWGPDLKLNYVADEDGAQLDHSVNLGVTTEWPNLSSGSVYVEWNSEKLAREDFPALSADATFPTRRVGISGTIYLSSALQTVLDLSTGEAVNFVPPTGNSPYRANSTDIELSLTARLGSDMTIEVSNLYSRLSNQGKSGAAFTDLISRAKLSYWWTTRWLTRVIATYEDLSTEPGLSSLESIRVLNLDAQLSWQSTPGRAWYLGYNHDLGRDDLGAALSSAQMLSNSWNTRSKNLYIKFSYSFP